MHIHDRHTLPLTSLFLSSLPFMDSPTGNTMHVAAGTGNMQTLRGAMAEGGGTICQTNAYGNTPLHVACECGQFEAAELLLTSKHIHPCLGAKNTVNQATPLTCAKIYKLRYGQLRADHFNKAYGSVVGWVLASVCRTSHHEANALAIEALLKTWGVENKVKVAM
jgi:hypothetical protein